MKILKQRNIGTFLGMAKIVIGNVSPYVNWVSLALVGIMSFYTTLSPLFSSWGIQFPFWMFILLLVFIIIVLMIVEWIFVLPSVFGATSIQAWEHENPMREKLESMEKEILEIKKMLNDKTNNDSC